MVTFCPRSWFDPTTNKLTEIQNNPDFHLTTEFDLFFVREHNFLTCCYSLTCSYSSPSTRSAEPPNEGLADGAPQKDSARRSRQRKVPFICSYSVIIDDLLLPSHLLFPAYLLLLTCSYSLDGFYSLTCSLSLTGEYSLTCSYSFTCSDSFHLLLLTHSLLLTRLVLLTHVLLLSHSPRGEAAKGVSGGQNPPGKY